ncbi:MAG TPA: L,D-transpeptidase family protein [Candidatus Paceibacterota bacterium]|nr:L,D-transpeptidase family protein [Candidatus Paceibacterota bacterium]
MRSVYSHAIPVLAIVGVLAAWGLAVMPTEPEISNQEVEPAAIAETASSTPPQAIGNYIEIVGSCGPHFQGECVNVRSGPGDAYPAVSQLRNGVVLMVATTTSIDSDGRGWSKIIFNEWIRYPERVSGEWYVASEYTRSFRDTGSQELDSSFPTALREAGTSLGLIPEKRIVVDRSEQKLYAYENDTLFLESAISTGLDLTPTPRGTFTVYRKTPSRYMQGPLPGISNEYYDLPGVPWNLYFTKEGGAIHGAYWHDEFGTQHSHGCVNLPLDSARILYDWAPLGTKVVVQD